jgi:hypothetical protein
MAVDLAPDRVTHIRFARVRLCNGDEGRRGRPAGRAILSRPNAR